MTTDERMTLEKAQYALELHGHHTQDLATGKCFNRVCMKAQGFLEGHALAKAEQADADEKEFPHNCAKVKRLTTQLSDREAEIEEQCRLNGIGASREAALLAEVARLRGGLEATIAQYEAALSHHRESVREVLQQAELLRQSASMLAGKYEADGYERLAEEQRSRIVWFDKTLAAYKATTSEGAV